MRNERGVHQVPMAGGLIQVNLTTTAGAVPVTFLIDPSAVSPELRRQMLERAHRWLDRLDPPLRLMADAAPPARLQPTRSPGR